MEKYDHQNSELSFIPIPVFNDNYIWVIKNNKLNEAIIVDPGEAQHILEYLKKNNLKLRAIFITHKHNDHTGGIKEIIEHHDDICVYGNVISNVPEITHPVSEKTIIKISGWLAEWLVLETPGHTFDHIAFYSEPNLFCGDTLFSAGCGRVFEGTYQQMLNSLKKIAALPNETLVYCAHEYTVANLKFASAVEPENIAIKNKTANATELRLDNKPTLPSKLKNEKEINPFLRCHIESIIKKISTVAGKKLTSELEVFEEMRKWKNRFS